MPKMDSVKERVPLLRLLAFGTKRQQLELLRQANPGLIRCLCECALNLLKGNIPLTPKQKTFLKRHKTGLRYLTQRNRSLKHKKQRLTQRGGGAFLPVLLKVVLSLL